MKALNEIVEEDASWSLVRLTEPGWFSAFDVAVSVIADALSKEKGRLSSDDLRECRELFDSICERGH